jgi:hypothetical protein
MIIPGIIQKALGLRLHHDLGKPCYNNAGAQWSEFKPKGKDSVFVWWRVRIRKALMSNDNTQYIDHQ